MTKKELIEALADFDDDYPVMILDPYYPREISIGPKIYFIQYRDKDNSSDCEELLHKPAILVGFY